MKISTILFVFLVILFTSCGGGGDVSQEEEILNTPQPNVANESIRPPQIPSL